MSLTDRLDALMASRGIKNKLELSRQSGIPYTTIDGIYKRDPDGIKLSTLRSLCSFFNCSLDFLANGEDNGITRPIIYELIDAAQRCNDDDIRQVITQLEKDWYYNQRLNEYKTKLKEMKDSEAEHV